MTTSAPDHDRARHGCRVGAEDPQGEHLCSGAVAAALHERFHGHGALVDPLALARHDAGHILAVTGTRGTQRARDEFGRAQRGPGWELLVQSGTRLLIQPGARPLVQPGAVRLWIVERRGGRARSKFVPRALDHRAHAGDQADHGDGPGNGDDGVVDAGIGAVDAGIGAVDAGIGAADPSVTGKEVTGKDRCGLRPACSAAGARGAARGAARAAAGLLRQAKRPSMIRAVRAVNPRAPAGGSKIRAGS